MRESEMNQAGRVPRGSLRFGGGGGLANDMILKKSAVGVERWSTKGGKATTFRLLPVPTEESCTPDNPRGSFAAYRLSDAPDDFGYWFEIIPVVRFFGTNSLSFVLYDPAKGGEQAADNPCWMIWNGFTQAKKVGHQHLGEWIPYAEKGGVSEFPVLKAPETAGLFNCFLMAHNDKVYSPPRGSADDDNMVLITLPLTAFREMFDIFNQKGDDGRLICPDPIAPAAGVFVTVFQKQYDPRTVGAGGSAFGGSRARDSGGGKKNKSEELSYTAVVSPTWTSPDGRTTYNASDVQHVEHLVREKAKPIRPLIDFKTPEEQVQLISRGFPPTLIAYVFESTRYWDAVPVDVKNQLRATAVQAGWGGPPQPHAAPAGYGRPSAGYGQPSAGYGPPTAGYGQPPAASDDEARQVFSGSKAPPMVIPPGGFGGHRHESAADQPPPAAGFGGQRAAAPVDDRAPGVVPGELPPPAAVGGAAPAPRAATAWDQRPTTSAVPAPAGTPPAPVQTPESVMDMIQRARQQAQKSTGRTVPPPA